MTVNQRGQSWQASVSFKGTRLRKDFASKQEALRWEAETLDALKSGRYRQPETIRRVTLKDHLDWVYKARWMGSKGEGTAMINARHVVEALGPDRDVSTLHKDDFVALKEAFRARGNSDATINRKLAAFSVLMREANERGLLQRTFKVGMTRERQHRIRVITPEEEQDMLTWCRATVNPLLHDYIAVSLDTGFRQGEVLRIEKQGCNQGKQLWTYNTKAGNNRRVPLTDRAWLALTDRAEKLVDPKAKIFDIDPDRLRDRWKQMASDVGLANDDQFVPHVLRHTFCNRLLERSVDIVTVKELAVHANLSTTQRYVYTAPERMTRAITVLEQCA